MSWNKLKLWLIIYRFSYWIKNKKAAINVSNKKDTKCFQYAVTVALNYEEWKNHPQRIAKVEPFINKYSCEGINYPSKKDDSKKLVKNNVNLLLMFCILKKKLYPAYVWKHNSNHEKQVILLMISNREGRWHYLAVKKTTSIIKRNNL